MSVETIGLILLGYTRLGDGKLVAHTLSREYGRRGFIARPGKGGGKMSLFLPLNLLEAEIVQSSKSSLWTARKISARHPLIGIRNNLHKNTMTLFMSETLTRVLRDGMMEDGLYEWLERSILTLDGLQADFSNFHIRFLLEFAGALGFSPTFDDIAPFAEKHLAQIKPFLTSGFSESMLIPLRGEDRNALCEDLLRYLEYHTESAIHVHSLAVLREVFDH